LFYHGCKNKTDYTNNKIFILIEAFAREIGTRMKRFKGSKVQGFKGFLD